MDSKEDLLRGLDADADTWKMKIVEAEPICDNIVNAVETGEISRGSSGEIMDLSAYDGKLAHQLNKAKSVLPVLDNSESNSSSYEKLGLGQTSNLSTNTIKKRLFDFGGAIKKAMGGDNNSFSSISARSVTPTSPMQIDLTHQDSDAIFSNTNIQPPAKPKRSSSQSPSSAQQIQMDTEIHGNAIHDHPAIDSKIAQNKNPNSKLVRLGNGSKHSSSNSSSSNSSKKNSRQPSFAIDEDDVVMNSLNSSLDKSTPKNKISSPLTIEILSGGDAPLVKVCVTAACQQCLLTQALTTEREEVVCLLLGEYNELEDYTVGITPGSISKDVYLGAKYGATVHCVEYVVRHDKSKDRVEVSPEQLSTAMNTAERKNLRVIGWAHSHPHISVFPSHVDLQTQYNMQQLDSRFFGIILSCFDQASSKVQMSCFQAKYSDEGRMIGREIPLLIVPCNIIPRENDTFVSLGVDLPTIIHDEEQKTFHSIIEKEPDNNMKRAYHSTLYFMAMCNLLDKLCAPMEHIYRKQIAINKQKIRLLQGK